MTIFQELAAAGHCAPIGTHLILHEQADPELIALDGTRLGTVIERAAERFATPLAIPLMDLTLEKAALLGQLGVPDAAIESHHFADLPGDPGPLQLTPRMRASCEAIHHIASKTSLHPIGMGIGPFSLVTKLLADPITPVFLAGSGMGPEEEPEVAVLDRCLEVSLQLVLDYLRAQVEAGAKAVIVCEPAANLVYFSPNQLEENFEIFDRFVLAGMRKIRGYLRDANVDLIFHDCGELTDGMVRSFAALEPAMLSLGSSRRLWEDARHVSKNTVLYGNLPTKRFYSPQLPVAEVGRLCTELRENMRSTGHPFILGSECDILSVDGSEQEIHGKVRALIETLAHVGT